LGWLKRGKVLENKEGGEQDEIESFFLEKNRRVGGICGRKT
jgi:hypothetical protein